MTDNDKQTHRHIDIDRHTDTQAHRHTDTQTHTETHRHTQTENDRHRQTDRQTLTDTHRHTDTHAPFTAQSISWDVIMEAVTRRLKPDPVVTSLPVMEHCFPLNV